MFETHTTALILCPSMEAMNDASSALAQRYEPAFAGEQLETMCEQADERIADLTRRLWRDLPEDQHEVSYEEIMTAYDAEYDF